MDKPRNIFEVINENIATVSEDLHTLMTQVSGMQQEIIALSLMFNAPEQPTTAGEEGVVTESRRSGK